MATSPYEPTLPETRLAYDTSRTCVEEGTSIVQRPLSTVTPLHDLSGDPDLFAKFLLHLPETARTQPPRDVDIVAIGLTLWLLTPSCGPSVVPWRNPEKTIGALLSPG